MPILTETFDGTDAGMNVAADSQNLEDNEARYMQDILLDRAGEQRRRGPLNPRPGLATFGDKGSGIVQTLDPNGANRVAVLHGDGSNAFLGTLSDLFSTKTDLTLPTTLPTTPPTNPYSIVSVGQAVGGGALIGISDKYGSPTSQILALWRGARKANYSTGTASVTRGTKAVTGSATVWGTNAEAGMALFATTADPYTNVYIGTVLSVNTNTSITLEDPALHTVSGGVYTLQSLRGLNPKVQRGRITCDVASTAVTGATTKFRDQGMTTGVWQLYRLSDLAFIGKVTTVTNNTSITLAANAAISMANESYVAYRVDGDFSMSTLGATDPTNRKVGFMTTSYAERQWFANRGSSNDETTRVWFSEPTDPEALDLSPADGDFVNVGTTRGAPTPIRGIASAYNALLIYKENETYALRGTSRSSFAVQKLTDDGTLGGMSIQPYAGGVIWAGRDGVYFYDGIQPENVTQGKLGDYYKNMMRTFDPSRYRLWSMVVREHYFLFIEFAEPNIAVVKGTQSVTPSMLGVCINLPTRAITMTTNLNIRGAVQLPADTGEDVWFVVNGYSSTRSQLSGLQAGGAAVELSKDIEYSTKITVAADAWAPRITARLDGLGSAPSGTSKMRASLHANNAGIPGSLLAEGNEVIINANQAAGDVDFDLKDGRLITAGTYWLTLHVEKPSFVRVWQQAAGAGSRVRSDRAYKLGASDPYGAYVSQSLQDRVYLQSAPTGSQVARVCLGTDLFDAEGVDSFGCDSGEPGPDFYFESKKFSAGDSLRKKLFKQLAVHYLAQGGNVRLDTVVGLNNLGKTSTSVYPASVLTWDQVRTQFNTWDDFRRVYPTWDAVVLAVFKPKRVKFLKRSTHLSFRLYQSSPLMSRVQIGPFSVGYKLQRPGRI